MDVRRSLASQEEPVGGRLELAAGIAAVLIAGLVIATFAYVRAGIGAVHHGQPVTIASPGRLSTPKPTESPTKPNPVIATNPWQTAHLVSYDADALDATDAWALLTNCIMPMTGRCHYYVARSGDAGRTWSKPYDLGPTFDPTHGDAPRHLWLLNTLDGFAYGGTSALVTHDGGRHWASVALHPTFFVFVTGHGRQAWIGTYPCAKGVSCSYQIWASSDAGRTWKQAASLPSDFYPYVAVPFARTGLLLSNYTGGSLVETLDGEATWKSITAECNGNLYGSAVATIDGIELWDLCNYLPADPSTGISDATLMVSEDGGTSWSRRAVPRSLGDVVILVSTGTSTAVIASNQSTIAITRDGGVTWTQVGPDHDGFLRVRFAGSQNGWAIDVSDNVWATTDGGDHWTDLTAA